LLTRNTDSTFTSYAGDGTSGIYLWGAQLSVGPYPLDYTPTTTAAVYGPRFDYDPVTLAARGLLIEEQRTNLLTYSEQFDNAAWTKTDVTVTANLVVAPDGITTADKIVASATTAFHFVGQSPTIPANSTVSVYMKAAEYTTGSIFLSQAGNNGAVFNLSNGTVVSVSGTGNTASIASVGNGWYRCSVTNSGDPADTVRFGPADGAIASFTGDGNSGIYLWGAQVETGAFATSYIPTVAASVTRSADVASVNTLSPWYNATEGTLFVEAVPVPQGGANNGVASLTDGTTSNRMSLQGPSSGNVLYRFVSSGGNFTSANSTFPTNSGFKAALTYAASDQAFAVNGVLGTGITSVATVPTVNQLRIGVAPAVTELCGHLRRVAYYPRRLTNVDLQTLTA